MQREDLTGRVFGRLTVLRYSRTINGRCRWWCLCSCGNEHEAEGHHLKGGRTSSCGCYGRESLARNGRVANLKHGHFRGNKPSPEYQSWHAMIARCHAEYDIGFPKYGARGITVCDRWKESFTNFLADMGERPDGTTLDRIDSAGNYEPNNCRWATREQQNRNRGDFNLRFTIGDRTMTLPEWVEQGGGASYATVHKRLDAGWSPERAIFTPTRRYR